MSKNEVMIQLRMTLEDESGSWRESFPEIPPEDIYIFPKGAEIYRSGGRFWGSISAGSKGKEIVAIDLTGKIRFQPKIHPFFLSLVSSSVFIEGRGDHEQVGGNYLKLRASRESGLKGSRRLEAWQSWCQEMHEQGSTWDELRDSVLLKIKKTS